MNLNWRLEVERGASSATWDSRTIFAAMARIQRYWNYNFVQSTTSPWVRIVLTRQVRPGWAMWTSGRVIYVPAAYRWVNRDQSILSMVHEMGHVFGSKNHAPPGNVMQASIGDPYIQFTQLDAQYWFGQRFRPGVPRPWQEPNHWRPLRNGEFSRESFGEVTVGCANRFSLMDWFRDMVTPKKILEL